jgi:TPR repeat protein
MEHAPPKTWIIPTRWRPLIVLALFGGFASFMLWERVQATAGLFWAFAVSTALFGFWLGWLFLRMKREGTELTIDFRPRLPHWIQMLIHGSIFVYWGLHWEGVFEHMPLIAAQVLFAYLMEMCLAWTQYRNFRLGFGPVPIVGSTNLFLWFKDPFFGAQFGMLAVSYLARQFIRWEREGQKIHIFNPSAIGLAVAAAIVISGGWVHHTWGAEISITLGSGPYAFEQLFLAGALVMVFFDVALMTMSAAVSMVLIGLVYYQLTGVWFFVDTAIPIAVFLGMNLLLTDPVTSPHSEGGKVLFGVLYTTGVMGLYIVLREMERPATGGDPGLTAAFFDKLLFVPILNVAAVLIERVGRKLLPIERIIGSLQGYAKRGVYLGIWVGAFMIIRPQLVEHPGASVAFWEQACTEEKPWACDNVRRLQYGPCEGGDGAACHNLGVVYEFGEGTQKDVELAAGFYSRACELKMGEGCSNLGALLMTDSERPDKAQEAMKLFTKACELNSGTGCLRLGSMFMHAMGVPADPPKGRSLFEKGCTANSGQACHLLAQAELAGQGGAKAPKQAVEHLRKGCTLKFAPACDQLKIMGVAP